MAHAYTEQTVESFGSLRTTDPINGAAMKDDEASICDNFSFTDMRTLIKRLGFQARNTNITSTLVNPVGGPNASPTSIRVLAIQRRANGVVDRIWFSDTGRTDLWSAELPNITNITRTLSPANTPMTNVEWMVEAAIPTQPYGMQAVRSGGNLPFGIGDNGSIGIPATGPSATHCTLFKDRLFAVNSAHGSGEESRLYWTDPPGFGTWSLGTNFIDIQPGNGEFCVATVVFNDQLIIFKNSSTWVLTVDGQPTSWVLRNLHPSLGCVGRGTPWVINGFIYFLTYEGLYKTDGTTFERISHEVDLYLSNLLPSTVQGVLDIDAYYFDNKYILFPPSGGTTNNQPLVYDINVGQWSRWVAGGSPQLNFSRAAVYVESVPVRLYIGGRTVNAMYSMGDNIWQDNGGNYSCIWRSKRFTGGSATKMKRNFGYFLDVGYTSTEPQSVAVLHNVDNVSVVQPHAGTAVSTTPVGTYDFARKTLRYAGAGYNRAMYSQITYAGDKNFEIFSMTWLNQARDLVNKSN